VRGAESEREREGERYLRNNIENGFTTFLRDAPQRERQKERRVRRREETGKTGKHIFDVSRAASAPLNRSTGGSGFIERT